jgi:hypothetical protein
MWTLGRCSRSRLGQPGRLEDEPIVTGRPNWYPMPLVKRVGMRVYLLVLDVLLPEDDRRGLGVRYEGDEYATDRGSEPKERDITYGPRLRCW